jgi:hypothetical protein
MPITVLNPTSLSEAEPLRMARRLDSLDGTLIGVLDNGKVNTDRIFRLVDDSLRRGYGVREVMWRRKHNFSRPAPSELLAELSACDAIITGIGD